MQPSLTRRQPLRRIDNTAFELLIVNSFLLAKSVFSCAINEAKSRAAEATGKRSMRRFDKEHPLSYERRVVFKKVSRMTSIFLRPSLGIISRTGATDDPVGVSQKIATLCAFAMPRRRNKCGIAEISIAREWHMELFLFSNKKNLLNPFRRKLDRFSISTRGSQAATL